MFKVGLIGKSLTHSFSPNYFKNKFEKEGIKNVAYHLFELTQIEEITELLRIPHLVGLNVTVPYKTAVMPFLDEIDASAAAIGAVNCIVMHDGLAKGYNTDWIGFKDSIQPLLKPFHQRALILGTGGASKAVCYGLEQLGISSKLVSTGSQGDYHYTDLSEALIQTHQIIVNCTPVGMYPNTDENPFPCSSFLHYEHLCYDLIYNPAKTKFLQEAEQQGANIKNGQEMLEIQADLSWQKWRALCDY